MRQFRPKYITFDCYGTLIHFEMKEMAHRIYAHLVSAEIMAQFVSSFSAYRFDEILGDWKPYREVLHNALARTCEKYAVPFRDEDASAIYAAVPSWGPHADVVAGLSSVAHEYPLVALTNAADEQIMTNVERLGTSFHSVFTAEQANAYKPRFRAFEYMFDMLQCGPEDVLHCSSSFRYDLMSAHGLGIKNKVWIDRGHEPANPWYEYTAINDLSELAAVVGLEATS